MGDLKKILLIDDSQTVQMIMGSSLQASGYLVIYKKTAEEGMKTAIEEKPDLILLDLMLPDKNGLDVLKELKEKEETKNIPVIILTGRDIGEEVVKGRQLGASDYCVKLKTTPKEMQEKIEKLIGK